MGWFYRHFRLNRNESLLTLNNNLAINGTLSVQAVSDGDGSLARRYVVETADIDISGATAATIVLMTAPVDTTLLRAYYVVTEAFAGTISAGAIQLGVSDADGTSNADVDAFVLGKTDKANGLLTTAATGALALNKVQALTFGGTLGAALPAGKCLTATHVQGTGATAGKIKVIVEYRM